MLIPLFYVMGLNHSHFESLLRKSALACSLLLLLSPFAYAKVHSARIVFEIDAGKRKTVRLKNIPHGSAIKVTIKTSDAVFVSFLNEAQYRTYPYTPFPLFQSTVRDTVAFTVTIPVSGHYYIISDNTSGSRKVVIEAVIHGAGGPADPPRKGKDSSRQKNQEIF